MEIILLTDIANLGHKDDIVDVKQGYGRNYLIPQGYAILATPSARKVVAENLRQRAHKEAKLKAEALQHNWLRLNLRSELKPALPVRSSVLLTAS